jgi:PAS domain-containing protein
VCGSLARFEEHLSISHAGISFVQPSWVCRCGTEGPVRFLHQLAQHTAPPVVKPPKGVERGLKRLRQTVADVGLALQQPAGESEQRVITRVSGPSLVSVFVTNDAARYVAANAAACVLTGHEEAQLRTLTVVDLSGRRSDEAGRRWQRFLFEGRFEGHDRLRRRSGDTVGVWCCAAAHVAPGLHVSAVATLGLLRSVF